MASSIKEAFDSANKLKHKKIINKKNDEALLVALEEPPAKISKVKTRHYQKSKIPIFIKPSVKLPGKPKNNLTTQTHIGKKGILIIDRSRHNSRQMKLSEKSIFPVKVDGGTVERRNKNGQLQAIKAQAQIQTNLLDITCYGPHITGMNLPKIHLEKAEATYTLDIPPQRPINVRKCGEWHRYFRSIIDRS